MKASEYLDKKILFINPDTEKEETGTVTAVEDDDTLEINGEYIASPEDVKLTEEEVETETEEIEEKVAANEVLTAENILAIEDKSILKAILKENNIRPTNPGVYKTAETLQKFIIESLQLKDTVKVTKEAKLEKKTVVKPEKKVENPIPAKTPKEKKEKKDSMVGYICHLILSGETNSKVLFAKVQTEFPNKGEKAINSNIQYDLYMAKHFGIIK